MTKRTVAENETSRTALSTPGANNHGKQNGNGSGPDRHQVIGDPLRDSEVRYRRLFESAKDGILILDAESGRITDANEAYAGGEFYVLELARSLRSRGYSVWVSCRPSNL